MNRSPADRTTLFGGVDNGWPWAAENLDVVGEMLRHPAAVPGLSDGGAHVGTICDVSFPTTLLQWWGRDRPTGRIPVETLIASTSHCPSGRIDMEPMMPGNSNSQTAMNTPGRSSVRPGQRVTLSPGMWWFRCHATKESTSAMSFRIDGEQARQQRVRSMITT